MLRTNLAAFGHRMLMDFVVPGRRRARPRAGARGGDARRMRDGSQREIAVLRDIYDEHAGLQDRFRACGIVTPELAAKLGLAGLAGRASGRRATCAAIFAVAPYDALAVRKVTRTEGDVAARVAVRFDEALESLRLIRVIVDAMPDGRHRACRCRSSPPSSSGLGYVEGWRGPVLRRA